MGVQVSKKRLGRPQKPKAELRRERVELRMSKAEYRKLEEKAKAAGVTVSEFLRQCAEKGD